MRDAALGHEVVAVQQEEIAAYISRINRITEENEQLKKEYELLRGRHFLLMNKMD